MYEAILIHDHGDSGCLDGKPLCHFRILDLLLVITSFEKSHSGSYGSNIVFDLKVSLLDLNDSMGYMFLIKLQVSSYVICYSKLWEPNSISRDLIGV
jgi:hypothetical protein